MELCEALGRQMERLSKPSRRPDRLWLLIRSEIDEVTKGREGEMEGKQDSTAHSRSSLCCARAL